jgi:hypothetical protein
MGGMRTAHRDQASQKPPGAPLDFARGRLVYSSQMHRRRNRRYRLLAALLSLAVGTGIVAVLLAGWLTTLLK